MNHGAENSEVLSPEPGLPSLTPVGGDTLDDWSVSKLHVQTKTAWGELSLRKLGGEYLTIRDNYGRITGEIISDKDSEPLNFPTGVKSLSERYGIH